MFKVNLKSIKTTNIVLLQIEDHWQVIFKEQKTLV